jgi:uncharacterized protein (DUF2141 family)
MIWQYEQPIGDYKQRLFPAKKNERICVRSGRSQQFYRWAVTINSWVVRFCATATLQVPLKKKSTMKYFAAIIFSVAVSSTLAQTVEVTIKNVKEPKGEVRVGLFSDPKKFLKEPLMGKTVKAQNGELKVVFDQVPAGTYAISIIHDENENGELDSNFFGMPKEGFGFSNDAMGSFGPPDFEKASFKVAQTKEAVAISMRYL